MLTHRIAKSANIGLLALSMVFILNALLRISRTYHLELNDPWLEFAITLGSILVVCVQIFLYCERINSRRARAFGRLLSVAVAAVALLVASAVFLAEMFLPFPMRTRIVDEKFYRGYFYRLYQSGCGVPCKPSVDVTKETLEIAGIRLVKPVWSAAETGGAILVHLGETIEVRVGSRTIATFILKE